MVRNAPKRQHYIPEMLLNNFCDESGRVWVANGTRVYPTIPRKVFVQGHLYTRSIFGNSLKYAAEEDFLKSIEKSYEYEDRLGEIEGRAGPAVKQIVNQGRQGECPQLSIELTDAWKRFVIAMARRTPESQDRVAASEGHVDDYYEVAKESPNRNGYPWPDRETLYQDRRVLKHKNLVLRNIDAKFAAGDDPHAEKETQRFSRETGLCVLVIRIPGRSFVIGSHGLTIVDRNLVENVTAISWLPIAPDIAVGVTPFPNREFLSFLDSNNGGEQVISAMNTATSAMSEIIVGQSEALVRSLGKG